jgi:hypothetical protein
VILDVDAISSTTMELLEVYERSRMMVWRFGSG